MRIHIDSLDDPRVAPYRALKDRELRAADGRFVAEGRNVVLRLIASRYEVESVLVTERYAEAIAREVPAEVPRYVAANEVIDATIGFRFHQGVLAIGRATTIGSVDALLAGLPRDEPATLVVAHELNNVENLGSIIRIAAGFGAAGLLLGPRTADPFYRQSIRVSMGTVFSLPLAQSDDLIADLGRVRDQQFQTIATVIDADAEPLSGVAPTARSAIVLGSEAHGLDEAISAACDRRVTIPMQLGTDSLNVSIAAAVFLYHLTSTAGGLPKRIEGAGRLA
jgi:tRNA G18 (ribose-2'-O)-methylase SpoU